MALGRRKVKRGPAFLAPPRVWLRAGIQKRLDDGRVAPERRVVKRGEAVFVPRVQLRAGIQKRLDDGRVAIGRRPMKRGAAMLVSRRWVGPSRA